MHARTPRAGHFVRMRGAVKSLVPRLMIAAVAAAITVTAPTYLRELMAPPPYSVLAYTVLIRLAKRDIAGELDWRGNGSGTIVYAENGYSLILTNYHVPEGADRILVIGQRYDEDGRIKSETYVLARVLRFSKTEDLALLRVEYGFPEAAQLAERVPRLSTPIIAAGAQWGWRPFLSRGELTSLPSSGWFQASAPLFSGVSGGGYYAFIEGRYQLIGVPSRVGYQEVRFGRSSQTLVIPVPHLGRGIDIKTVREFLSGSPEFKHLRAEPPP